MAGDGIVIGSWSRGIDLGVVDSSGAASGATGTVIDEELFCKFSILADGEIGCGSDTWCDDGNIAGLSLSIRAAVVGSG